MVMDGASIAWFVFSLGFAVLLAARGLKRRSLSLSGAVAAFFVGAITMLCGLRFGGTLIAFYLSSSWLTKYRADVKQTIEADFKEGGQRDWSQVLANSAVATCLCLLLLQRGDSWQRACLGAAGGGAGDDAGSAAVLAAFVAHYACCAGDTWASELGVLSRTPPRLVSTWQVVPRGTNGGVTTLGAAASAAGGLFVGLCFWLLELATVGGCHLAGGGRHQGLRQLATLLISPLPLGLLAGTLGSALDSLLGATLQYSGFCSVRKKVVSRPGGAGGSVAHVTGVDLLTNSAVNAISAAAMAALAAAAAAALCSGPTGH